MKLWSVLPKLFEGLPLRDPRALLLTGLERASIAVLVASSIFQLATGLANAAQWYPWSSFSFRTTHYAIAWVAIGALVVHIAVKLPIIRDVLTSDIDATTHDRADGDERRTAVAARPRAYVVRRRRGRRPRHGRQHRHRGCARSPSSPSAPARDRAACRSTSPRAPPASRSPRRRPTGGWRCVVDGAVAGSLSYADLRAMPQHTVDLPIACVEGWSAQGTWSGVRLADLLASVDAPADRDVPVTSLQESGPYRRTTLPANFAADERTLLALDLSGEPLSLDHGYPCRLIAPNRPGVLQTKWLSRLEVTT